MRVKDLIQKLQYIESHMPDAEIAVCRDDFIDMDEAKIEGSFCDFDVDFMDLGTDAETGETMGSMPILVSEATETNWASLLQ